MTADITHLGAMLRAWRGRVAPESAGLAGGHRRRVSGLRREDLAELADISVDYVVRLEQGRHTTPSAQVTANLARALRLTDAERDHLYRLAGLAPPSADEVSDHIPPGLHRMLDRLGDAAVAVFAADWQLLWWNRAWAALLGDPSPEPPALRNFARDTFPVGGAGPRLTRWPVSTLDQPDVEVSVVSDLRRATGRFPRSERLAGLVRDLLAGSPRFAELWASGVVGAHRESHKVVQHPEAGAIAVDCDVLTDGDAERKIVVLTSSAPEDDGSDEAQEPKMSRMGVSLYYTARRAAPLSDTELAAVGRVVDDHNATAPFAGDEEGLYLYDELEPGTVLNGSTKLPGAEDRAFPSLVHWLAAVTALRTAVPDADWTFTLDDYEIEWQDHTGYHLPGLDD
ncbi:helix-turn-helix transcriptional regulator [Lentzea sp. NPDC059081]|uniref:helix-turn-helix transcriptional regulator n=1 Tax=Lentzea sp. NPDC059081 TaxID=3346719 RepID=UPI0036CF6480